MWSFGNTTQKKKLFVINLRGNIREPRSSLVPWSVGRALGSGSLIRDVRVKVGRALGSHYAKYTTRITLFYQGKLQLLKLTKGFKCPFFGQKCFNMFAVQCS